MNQRQEIIERLKALELEGGSHQMLSDICRAVAPGAKYGWTQGACDGLRMRLISFLSETDEEALREAYTKGREDGINASYVSADEWLANHPYALAERGWHQAVDADNKPIHIGSLAKYNGSVGKVTQIAYTLAAVIVTTDKWVTWKLNEVHVVDTLTVEDVLEELLHEYDRDDSELTNGEIIGRFAAKLRLVVE